ncbi:MAG: hypothetical protein OXN17_02315 [Candidatus Poribacteria bacterium]|nr:hypothetical protein [Candidatus Poribacteria bacterium]
MRKAELQRRADMLIEQLSTEKLKIANDYLAYLQDKEAWEATHELASDPEFAKSSEHAEADVNSGKLKHWSDVGRDL